MSLCGCYFGFDKLMLDNFEFLGSGRSLFFDNYKMNLGDFCWHLPFLDFCSSVLVGFGYNDLSVPVGFGGNDSSVLVGFVYILRLC